MSTRIRLKRMGNTHRPYYRVTVVDQRKKRDGRVIEQLGTFDPLIDNESKQAKLVLPRCAYWLSVGAQPTDTVAMLFKRAGLKTKAGTPIDDQSAELLTITEKTAEIPVAQSITEKTENISETPDTQLSP